MCPTDPSDTDSTDDPADATSVVNEVGTDVAPDIISRVPDMADLVVDSYSSGTACSPSASSSFAPCELVPRPLDHELFELTNAFRAECKVHPLQWHRGLSRIAREHAMTVADGRAPFSHAGAKSRFSQCETKCVNIAENLARSEGFARADIPEAVVSGWRSSEGHRRNLLGPFDVCGIGFAASDDGTIFVTQLLALLDEDSAKRRRAKDAAVEALTSNSAVFAVAGLALRGPVLALAGGFLGSTVENRFGFRASAVPQVVCRKANEFLSPAACARCGAPASQGSELHVSSRKEVGRQAFCSRCLPPSNLERSNSDVWNYVV